MLGLYGHLAHADAIPYELAAAVYLAYAGFKFRGLLLPALPLRPAGRLRQSLQISSYLARGFSFVYFVAAWAAGYGLWTAAGAYQRAFSGGTLIDHLMHAVAVVVRVRRPGQKPSGRWRVSSRQTATRRSSRLPTTNAAFCSSWEMTGPCESPRWPR
jgi:hypothetical protein